MFNNNNNHIKPPISGYPMANFTTGQWSINGMPWKSDNTDDSVRNFVGSTEPSPSSSSNYPISTSSPFLFSRTKRKVSNDPNVELPSKQFISEEKMIKHISQLHISDNYPSPSSAIDDEIDEGDLPSTSYRVNMSAQELEDRLKNAQKITIAEQFKKSFKESETEIIPKILLDRMKQPCQSLILWKPPMILPDGFLTTHENSKSSSSDEDNESNLKIENDSLNRMDIE